MSKVSEQWSKANATSQGRTDANLANDSNNLGGIPAEEYATKQWVREYHDGKESNLKQYIDTQDASVLEQAKEYTNSQIRNQDFSNFAEISDLQALNNNLTSQITQGLAEQKNYTDSKTQAIVDDVNANFQDVNGAISTLNGNVNNLFQSVSNGKNLIAGAITDKGVPTSASDSYSTMASNIRSIPSGGGSIDPNYVNTSDATATASDILNGKTAYVKGQKVYGNLIYTKENEYEVNPDNPYPDKAEVELIYGEKEEELNITKVKHSSYNIYDISSDNRLLVAYDEDDNKIKTFLKGINALGEEAFVQDKSQTGELRTPEYTFADLGITGIENYQLGAIKFSIMNAEQDKSGYECRVALLFRKIVETVTEEPIYKCFIFRVSTYEGEIYHTNEIYIAGVEGSTSNNVYYNRWEIESEAKLTNACSSTSYTSDSVDLVWSSDTYTLAIMVYCNSCSYLDIYRFNNSSYGSEENYDSVVDLKYSITYSRGMWNGTYKKIQFANNDRIVNIIRWSSYGTDFYINDMLIFDEYMNLLKTYSESVSGGGGIGTTAMAITNDGLFCIDDSGYFYSVTINYATGDVQISQTNNLPSLMGIQEATFTKGDKFLITEGTTGTENNVKIYSIDLVNQTYKLIGTLSNSNNLKILSDLKSIELPSEQLLIQTVSDNKKELIGLKYQGQTFYNNIFNSGRFTAAQEDVRAGKTFIGWQGIPETGTMEVTE